MTFFINWLCISDEKSDEVLFFFRKQIFIFNYIKKGKGAGKCFFTRNNTSKPQTAEKNFFFFKVLNEGLWTGKTEKQEGNKKKRSLRWARDSVQQQGINQ